MERITLFFKLAVIFLVSLLGSYVIGRQFSVGMDSVTWWLLFLTGAVILYFLLLRWQTLRDTWQRLRQARLRARAIAARRRARGIARWMRGALPHQADNPIRARLLLSLITTSMFALLFWYMSPGVFLAPLVWVLLAAIFVTSYLSIGHAGGGTLNPLRRPRGEAEEQIFSLIGKPLRGLWLKPIYSVPLLASVPVVLGLLIAWIVVSLISNLNPEFFGRDVIWWTLFLSVVLLFNLLAWIDPETRRVPNFHVAVLKIFGMLTPIYLVTGYHVIPMAWGVFSTNRDAAMGPVIDSQEDNAEDSGLVYTGVVIVHLDNEDGQPKMVALATDNAEVQIRPTFRYMCIDPRKRLQQNKPIKDLNEASREMIRKIAGGLTTAPQLNSMHGAISGAVGGARIYFVRTRRSDARRGVHSGDLVLHEVTRRPVFTLGPAEYSEEVANELLQEVRANGVASFLDAASAAVGDGEEHDHDTIAVTHFYEADALADAFAENGYTLQAMPRIGEVDAPKPVRDAAAAAAAEVKQRDAAVADAETANAAAEILRRDNNLDPQTAAIAALSEENPNVRIIHIPNQGTGAVMVNAG